MTLRKILQKAETVPVVGLVSDVNYTYVHFRDGTVGYSAYTKSIIKEKLSVDLRPVRRGVDVDPALIQKKGQSVKLGDTLFKISRRNLNKWLGIIALIFSWCVSPSVSRGQNTAPVAVNDTLKVCNDIPTYFSVTANDYDANGDRLRLTSFTRPASGDLVAASNTGQFRLDWSFALSDTLSFQYYLKDLKFANLGSLQSNAGTVVLYSTAPYFYAGTYSSGTNSRITCRSENSAAASITGTARETNTAYSYILLDGNNGSVTIAPSSGGSVEFKIKD